MFEGFKKFIARGDMIDMAVGVVMGAAVTAVVNSIVNNLINPLIAMIFGKPNMDGLLAFTFNGATVSFGAILSAVLNFLIVAAAIFMVVQLLAKLKRAEEAAAEEARRQSVDLPGTAGSGETGAAQCRLLLDEADLKRGRPA